jgi:hypothetical protein
MCSAHQLSWQLIETSASPEVDKRIAKCDLFISVKQAGRSGVGVVAFLCLDA